MHNCGAMLKFYSGNRRATLLLFFIVLICYPAIYFAPAVPVIADEGVQLQFRVMGPAEEATFAETGEYQLIWSGEIIVPAASNITTTSGNTWHFFVDNVGGNDRYIAECVAGSKTGERHDRGAADGLKGATSVLAALEEASQQGAFSCVINDNYFPGMGIYVGSIGGHTNSGAVGWSYRVWNPDDVYAPNLSSDMFLLGYNSTPLSLPHEQVLWFWGASGSCYPLRVTLSESTVQIGEAFTATVEYYQEYGWSGTGDWKLLPEAIIEVDGESFTTDDNGEVGIYLEKEGSYNITASKLRDGASYYVPSDDSLQVHVSGGTTFNRWTQTRSEDFNEGELAQVSISGDTGDVRLDRGGTISNNYILDGAVDTLGGEHFYNEFRIINGSTLNVIPGEVLRVHANYIEVESGSTINADGAGYSGGAGSNGTGNDGFGVGGGSGAVNWSNYGGGGGGAGYGAYGGNGSYGTSVNATGGAGGYSYGKICTTGDDSFYVGSGGGGGAGDGGSYAGGAGGNGGGAIALESMSMTGETSIVIEGTISVKGIDGSSGSANGCGGGGGGSGGTILIKGKNVDIANGKLSVAAGDGGDNGGAGGGGGGGGGSGGHIKVFFENCNDSENHDTDRGYGGNGDPNRGYDGRGDGSGSEKGRWYDYLDKGETYSPVLPYYESGTFVSSAYDVGYAANFTAIQWGATLFSGTGIKFQIASNSNNATWEFLGPDGTAGSFYENSNTGIWSGHDGNRYIKYKAFLNTSQQGKTPVMNKVSIGYDSAPEIISFSVIDHGIAGINFGDLVKGSTNNPEIAQNSSQGAVTLVVAAETNVDCNIQIKASGNFSDGTGNIIPLGNASWSDSNQPGSASNMTVDYATVSTSIAELEKSVDIWHWVSIPVGQEPAMYETEYYYHAVKQ